MADYQSSHTGTQIDAAVTKVNGIEAGAEVNTEIKQDITAAGFTPVANTYYKHTGTTNVNFTNGVIYFYDGTEYKAVNGGETHTAGDGINISNNEISAKVGSGLFLDSNGIKLNNNSQNAVNWAGGVKNSIYKDSQDNKTKFTDGTITKSMTEVLAGGGTKLYRHAVNCKLDSSQTYNNALIFFNNTDTPTTTQNILEYIRTGINLQYKDINGTPSLVYLLRFTGTTHTEMHYIGFGGVFTLARVEQDYIQIISDTITEL